MSVAKKQAVGLSERSGQPCVLCARLAMWKRTTMNKLVTSLLRQTAYSSLLACVRLEIRSLFSLILIILVNYEITKFNLYIWVAKCLVSKVAP